MEMTVEKEAPSGREPKFEVYQEEVGLGSAQRWRWRLVAANGETVASGEDHRDVSDAIRAIETVERIVSVSDGPDIVIRRTK